MHDITKVIANLTWKSDGKSIRNNKGEMILKVDFRNCWFFSLIFINFLYLIIYSCNYK